jgi:hypothetical protein
MGGPNSQYLHDHGYLYSTLYQAGDRFWVFQGIEAAIFLGLALLLMAVSLWWIRRRVASTRSRPESAGKVTASPAVGVHIKRPAGAASGAQGCRVSFICSVAGSVVHRFHLCAPES